MLALDGRELIGIVLLTFASDGVSIILQQNHIASIGKLEVIQVIVSCDNRNDEIPFLGQGSEKDHGLHLRWDNHTGSREALESCTHLINLGTRMTIRVNTNAKGFFEVLIDAGRSGSAIRVFKAKPNFRCLVKVNDILLNGLLNSVYYITNGNYVLLIPFFSFISRTSDVTICIAPKAMSYQIGLYCFVPSIVV